MPLVLLGLLAMVVGLALLNLGVGSVALPLGEVVQALCGQGGDPIAYTIVVHHRLPQVATAALAGASLGGCGLVMQTLFRNPLADPSLLGINAGASLGAALSLLLYGGVMAAGSVALSGFVLTLVAAFVGALLVLALLLAIARRVANSTALLIVGVMLSFIVSSVVALLHFFASAEGLRAFTFWGMGQFSALSTTRLLPFALALLLPLAGLLLLVRPLDGLLLGSDYARSMGIDVERSRRWLLLLVGWLAAVVTAVCGPIAFLGLAAPHLARLLLRTALHTRLLPTTFLLGALLALLCLLVSHAATTPLPLNALTPLIGAPIIILLILRQR